MKQIVYISTAEALMSEDELIGILEEARTRNLKHNVTGVLLYSSGTFIQLLEGLAADVNLIYQGIERDTRHKNIIKLVDKPCSQRTFPDWTMGFSLINVRADELVGFLRSTDLILKNDKDHTVINILKTFIAANNLKINHQTVYNFTKLTRSIEPQ